MTRPERPTPSVESEELLNILAELDEYREKHGHKAGTAGDSAVNTLKAKLDDLEAQLREPPPVVPFEEEPDCHRAVELAAVTGRAPSIASGQPHPTVPSKSEDLSELGQYRDLVVLGRGGMGTVYRALHPRLDKTVAIKVLSKERTDSPSPSASARFEQEMRAVGRLEHPNIVRAMDANEHNGIHYLVMEYVDGVDLSKLVHRLGPLPIAEACELIRHAAVGLQHIHEHNMVHRDIKPSNLILTFSHTRLPEEGPREGEKPIVKILDLGLARLHNGDRTELTSTGQLMGTIDYMAPEQTGDSHDVDIRADIYSLGATLFKLLCNRAPYADDKRGTIIKKLNAMATKPVPAIRDWRPDVPDPLAAIVTRMLAREPNDRFATPAEVARALAPFAEGANLSALPTKWQGVPQSNVETSRITDQGTEEHLPNSLTETWTGQAGLGSAGESLRDSETGFEEFKIRESHDPTGDDRSSGQSASQVAPAPKPGIPIRWNRTTKIAAGMVPLFFFLGIVIWVDRTRIEVPEGSEVRIDEDGSVHITTPDAKLKTDSGMPKEPPVVPAKWQDAHQQADAAYDANRFEEALGLYDGLLVAMAENQQTDRAQIDSLMELIRQRQSLIRFIIERAKLPVEKQVELTQAKLAELNSEYNGKGRFLINDDRIVSVNLIECGLRDLSPLKGLTLSQAVTCRRNNVVDLSPLRGMALKGLSMDRTGVEDITPLEGMPLEDLNLNWTRVKDISALAGMPLTGLQLEDTRVSDIGSLKGMPLTSLNLKCTPVRDISVLQGMSLRVLGLGDTLVRDISVLKGMSLQSLTIHGTGVSDISVLEGMPLTFLYLHHTGVSDISPLQGLPLETLTISGTKVSDITPLAGAPLKYLDTGGSKVSDLTALAGAPLETLHLTEENITHGMDVIRNIESLETINSMPAAEFWKQYDAKQKAAVSKPQEPLVVPAKWQNSSQQADAAYDANRFEEALGLYDGLLVAMAEDQQTDRAQLNSLMESIRQRQSLTRFIIDRSKLPAEKQVEMTQAKLAKLNPEYTGQGTFSIQDDKVVGANLGDCGLCDLSPLKGLPLERLYCDQNSIVDLSPLIGMNLKRFHCSMNPVKDITLLAGMPLEYLGLNYTQVKDIRDLAGMPLITLSLIATGVSDISTLAGMPLTGLNLKETPVSDISSLVGMPLNDLNLYRTPVREISVLHGMPLRVLGLGETLVRDISVLKGMPLQSLHIVDTRVSDIAILKGMPLTTLYLPGTAVTDISPLQGLPLVTLHMENTKVSDITPLAGAPLKNLSLSLTEVSDVTSLAGVPLEKLQLSPENITQGMEVIRAIESLDTINLMPAAEFWKEYDAGQKAAGAKANGEGQRKEET
jgi:serine/threonine protein kinase/Leucine-rich repeat (LRR) protein